MGTPDTSQSSSATDDSSLVLVLMVAIIALVLIVCGCLCCFGVVSLELKQQIAYKQDVNNLVMSSSDHQSPSISSVPMHTHQLAKQKNAEMKPPAKQESTSELYQVDMAVAAQQQVMDEIVSANINNPPGSV